jgi:hypothetical protein
MPFAFTKDHQQVVQRRTDRHDSTLDAPQAFAIGQMDVKKIPDCGFAHLQGITVRCCPRNKVFHRASVCPDH